MLLLDVLPHEDHHLNCFEKNALSIIKWMEKEYRFVFSETWNFDFEEQAVYPNGEKIPLSERILVKRKLSLDLMENIHGIRLHINSTQVSDEEKIKCISCDLTLHNPVIVSFDTYYLPWSNNYNLRHESSHTFVVIGLDIEKGIVYCVDPTYTQQREELSLAVFLQGYTGESYKFDILPVSEVFDAEALFQRITNSVSENTKPNAIRKFAEAVKSTTFHELFHDFSLEQHLWESKLFQHILNIVFARHHFAKVLELLQPSYMPEKLEGLRCLVNEIEIQWQSVQMMIMKMFLMKDAGHLHQPLVSRLHEIADQEEHFIASLSLKAERMVEAGPKLLTAMEDAAAVGRLSASRVPLDAYLNNKAFGISYSDADGANFTNMGEYMLDIERTAEDRATLRFNPMTVQGARLDNISCKGQTIPIDGNVKTFLQFIGTSEWGYWKGKLHVHLSSGRVLEAEFMFPDWSTENRKYLQNAVLTGKRVYGSEIHDAHIFARTYDLIALVTPDERVAALTLPDLPNIHIFAIWVN